MLRVRTVRPLVCVLLAVSTAVGTAPAVARGCGCPRTRPAGHVAAQAPQVVAPAKSCCATPDAGCCAAKSCCGDRAKPKTTPPADPGLAGCSCARCECDQPGRTPPAAPSPTGPQFADQAAPAAAHPAPPQALTADAGPRVASAASHGSHPPTDLVITLSRLTC